MRLRAPSDFMLSRTRTSTGLSRMLNAHALIVLSLPCVGGRDDGQILRRDRRSMTATRGERVAPTSPRPTRCATMLLSELVLS